MHATVADVTSAVEKRDVEELNTINPTWKPVIDQDQLELLPKLLAPPEVLMIADKPESNALQTAWQESEKWNWKFENVVKHPTAPLPFYVIDLGKYKDADKVIWMKQEIGADRKLGEFVEKFVLLSAGCRNSGLRA